MRTCQWDAVIARRLWGLLLVLCLSGCSSAYHFRYRYTLIAPPDSTDGLEDDQVRIQLSPVPAGGMMQLAITNKSLQPMFIAWEQTYYLDPSGRRRSATESGLQWFRPSQWFTEDTRIIPGDVIRLQVHAGERQYVNPFSISSTAGGGVTVSGAPQPLLPTVGQSRAVGEGYQGQEFHFVLALRVGTDVARYPFTFRITDVEVQSQIRE
jgi:hypothetical protein